MNVRRYLRKLRGDSPDGRDLRVWIWRPHDGGHNFGDSLFLLLVNRMTERELETASADFAGPRFFPGGSVLHMCRDGDVAWGIGANLNAARWRRPRRYPNDVDIRSVRGPLTAAFVSDFLELPEPVVAGDSALLLPRYFPEWGSVPKQGRIGYVSHYSSASAQNQTSSEVLLIDPLRDPLLVVPEILSCDLVISSSLHGIIVAESFGIPAKWIREDAGGPPAMKFYDYYLQTGRAPSPCASLEVGIRTGGEPLPDLDDQVLLDTFPWDVLPRLRD